MKLRDAIAELEAGRYEAVLATNGNVEVLIKANALEGDYWELVNPIVQFEDIAVEVWQVTWETGARQYFDYDPKFKEGCEVVKLTGKVRKTIKPKVKVRKFIGKRSEFIKVSADDEERSYVPSGSELYAEWEG